MIRTLLAAACLLTLQTQTAHAQGASACTTQQHRALDFWVGDWDAYVTGAQSVVGRDQIERADVDCVIAERWTGADGSVGRSISMYDRPASRWEQLWLDSTGEAVHFFGEVLPTGGVRFISQGEVTSASPTPAWVRMTLTANADGTVRQVSETSADGQTWNPQLDLTYRRRASQ